MTPLTSGCWHRFSVYAASTNPIAINSSFHHHHTHLRVPTLAREGYLHWSLTSHVYFLSCGVPILFSPIALTGTVHVVIKPIR